MRLGITIARRKAAKTFEVITGPDVPLPEQIAAFKRLQADPAACEQFEEIELWNSTEGRVKSFRSREQGSGINPAAILPPAPAAEPAAEETPAGEPTSEREGEAAAENAGEPAESAAAPSEPAPAGMESVLPTSKKPKTTK